MSACGRASSACGRAGRTSSKRKRPGREAFLSRHAPLPRPGACTGRAQPLERIPPSAFRPRHCPRPACTQHRLDSPRRFRYTHAGSFHRKSDGRSVPRFRCLACGSRFSQAAFCVSYYLKRPELLVPIAAALNAGSAHRQIARSLGCAPSTVTRQAARLGRHALLLQALALQRLPRIAEPVVLDHFETLRRAPGGGPRPGHPGGPA